MDYERTLWGSLICWLNQLNEIRHIYGYIKENHTSRKTHQQGKLKRTQTYHPL